MIRGDSYYGTKSEVLIIPQIYRLPMALHDGKFRFRLILQQAEMKIDAMKSFLPMSPFSPLRS